MAPALTEPLSPTDKLNNTTVTARTTPTTRSSKKLTLGVTKKPNNNYSEKTLVSIKEKCKYIDGDISPSPRTTRSKDRDNKHLSLSSPLPLVTVNTKRNLARNNGCNKNSDSNLKKNEQMGLSAASPSFNNNNNNNKITDDHDTSTSQLLADLTNDTLTAQSCLQDQIKKITLNNKPLEQNFVINSTNPTLDAINLVTDTENPIAHMEAAQQSNEILKLELKDLKTLEVIKENETPTAQYDSKALQYCPNDNVQSVAKSEAIITGILEECASSNQSASAISFSPFKETVPKKTNTSKLEIINVEELPPVNTDSTMTASEVEDNLEERLSQLDGTTVPSIQSSQSTNKDANGRINENNLLSDADSVNLKIRAATPTEEKLSDVIQLQQRTPPPLISTFSPNSQAQQSMCTPQSITSAINLLGIANTPQSLLKDSDVGDLEDPEIEEVFKVLKGIESGGSSDLNICDLNVLFNEVYSSLKINEADMGSGNQSSVPATPPSIQSLKSIELKERQLEIEKRHQQMQRKIDLLTRRMRILQARHMCKHASEEIAGLFEWCARQANKCVGNSARTDNEFDQSSPATTWCTTGAVVSSGINATRKYLLKVIASRPPATQWNEELTVPVPTTQICTLLRKIETVANSQQLCTAPSTNYNHLQLQNRKLKKSQTVPTMPTMPAMPSIVTPTIATTSDTDDVVVGTLDQEVAEELTQVAGLLHSEMHEVQRAIDSDATESSSGGESADEMITFNNQQQQTLPITKRAAWRYSKDRAAIASRWSWLLSQIADLEIKIRQHSDLHQELLRSKGSVTCASSENGLRTNWIHHEGDGKELAGSCRTRGYDPLHFRKRKLIQTANLHLVSKKAARPSTIKCGCQWPLQPCALCTGRADPTAPRDLPDTMMMSDRIALLDPGYHPVLSFRENVNNALHFEAIARMPEWQQRVMKSQAKHIAKSVWKAEKEAAGGVHTNRKHGIEFPITKRKYIRKKDRLNEEKAGAAGANASNINAGLSSTPFNALATDVGNGTANLSTTSTPTTPLVANKAATKTIKKQVNEKARNSTIISDSSNYNNTYNMAVCQTSSNHLVTQKADSHNFSQTTPSAIYNTSINSINSNNSNSSINISNSKNYKNRKLSNSQIYNHHPSYTAQQHASISGNNFYSNNNPYGNMASFNGDINFLHSNDNWSIESFAAPSRTSSPTCISGGGGKTSGTTTHHKHERSLDRKNRTSYDIDNIVIPYSVAAATRVEILPYKEIPTPKWRLIGENDVVKNEIVSIDRQVKQQHEHEQLELKKKLNKNIPPVNGLIKNEEKVAKINNDDVIVSHVKKENLNQTNDTNVASEIKSEIESPFTNSNNNEQQNGAVIEATKGDVIHTECKDSIDKYVALHENKEEQLSKKIKLTDSPISVVKCEVMKNEIQKAESPASIVSNIVSTIENYASEYDDALDEDISDAAMIQRHERALTEERRKFQTYLKFPWSTRSRANRRIDSRAESSGANTPDPSSPASHTPNLGGGDHESIPSPVAPGTPFNQMDALQDPADISTSFLGVNLTYNKRFERRRRTSSKRDRELERRSSTPESKEVMPPFEPLLFPLNDQQYEELLRNVNCDQLKANQKSAQDSQLKCLRVSHLKRNHRTSNYASNNDNNHSSRRQKINNHRSIGLVYGKCTGGEGRGSVSGAADDSLIPDDINKLMPITCNNNNQNDNNDEDRHYLMPPNDNKKFHANIASIEDDDFCADIDDIYEDSDDDDDDYDDDDEYKNPVKRRKHYQNTNANVESDGDSTDTEPFQDDDPNDPEWRGECEERSTRKKA